MKLGDAPADIVQSRKQVVSENNPNKKPEFHALSNAADRRLIVLGGASGAGVVMTGAILSLVMNALRITPVAATSGTIVLLGGVAIGLACGGFFSSAMVPRVKQQGLLGETDAGDWSGDPLLAWDTAPGEDVRIFRL